MGQVENEAVARGLGEAFQAGDMQRMDALIADDIVWHQIGGPDLRGKEALRASAGGVDYEITARPIDVMASDDHAVALGEATATRAGRPYVIGPRRSTKS